VDVVAADWERLLQKLGMPNELNRRPPSFARVDPELAIQPAPYDDRDEVFYDWARTRLGEALERLSVLERIVVLLRYGCIVAHSQTTISQILRLEQSSISRAESRAIDKMRAWIVHTDAQYI
jgi:DNA-directed RNA polymerase specialized sigma subunit